MSSSQIRSHQRQATGGASLIVSVVSSAAKNHPVKFSLNIFGLLLLFFAAGFAPSREQQQASLVFRPACSAPSLVPRRPMTTTPRSRVLWTR
jgi:hypothetical protein